MVITNQRCSFVFPIPYLHVVRGTVFTFFQIKRCKLELEIVLFSVYRDCPHAIQFVRILRVVVWRGNFTCVFCQIFTTVWGKDIRYEKNTRMFDEYVIYTIAGCVKLNNCKSMCTQRVFFPFSSQVEARLSIY